VNKSSKTSVDSDSAALSVEEHSEKFLNAPDVAPSDGQSSYKYQADPMDDGMIYSAIQCYFTDVNDVRRFVQQL
jgi:hypothetical protein